jgi:hypothetical protein
VALDQSIFNNRNHVDWKFLVVVFTDISKHNPEYIEYMEEDKSSCLVVLKLA